MARKDIIDFVKRVTGMSVQTGPFAGLKLHDFQVWGNGEDIGPQLLGVYEQELHEFIIRFAAKKPSTIINLGCAEGYYAVGLARMLPNARVFAFDTDANALEACRANSELNGASDRVHLKKFCTPDDLAHLSKEDWNILVVSDCEGYEKILFSDPISIGALEHANCLIELHDYKDRDILPSLMGAFAASHRLSLIRSGARNPHEFPFLDGCKEIEKWMLVCENRPELQYWLACERRQDT